MPTVVVIETKMEERHEKEYCLFIIHHVTFVAQVYIKPDLQCVLYYIELGSIYFYVPCPFMTLAIAALQGLLSFVAFNSALVTSNFRKCISPLAPPSHNNRAITAPHRVLHPHPKSGEWWERAKGIMNALNI